MRSLKIDIKLFHRLEDFPYIFRMHDMFRYTDTTNTVKCTSIDYPIEIPIVCTWVRFNKNI